MTSNVQLADVTVDHDLDATGLLCPIPVYKAGLVLNQLAPGQVVRITCTDPGSLEDIPAMARQRGDVLLGLEKRDLTQVFWVEKGKP